MAAGSAARVLQWLAAVFRQLVASVLGTRPVPRHVAFIMDGNRRYAERQRMQQAAGHTFGYQRLIGALEWCLDLGVGCVSVYAFSIDNYHRSDEEVDTLMRLAEDKLLHMLQVRLPPRLAPPARVHFAAAPKRATDAISPPRNARCRSKRCCGGTACGCGCWAT
jgi:undecaprenyl pyrophosphate synthase